MTKLKYPQNGLYNVSKSYLDSVYSHLENAYNKCEYSVPSNFKYKVYMNNLSTLLNNYKKEISSISSAINKVDRKYDELESELYTKAKVLGNYKVENRERLVIDD